MYREKGIPDISEELAKAPITKIIEDIDCQMPRRVITLGYSGPNIRAIVRNAPRMLKEGMRITGTRTFIDEYYVDVTDPSNIVFHIYWHGIRNFDHRSDMWAWIRIKHGLLHPDGTGSMKIEFFAKVVTSWDRSSIIQRTPLYKLLIKIYNYIFYDNRRRAYVVQCREFQERMIAMMREFLKIAETAKYPRP